MWRSRKKFCFSSGVPVCVTTQMSHALQRLTNAGLFHRLLHTKAQSPLKAALISPKGSERQTTTLALPPALAAAQDSDGKTLPSSLRDQPKAQLSHCLPGFASVLLSRNDWSLQLLDSLASCGDFTRKLSLLQHWEEQPQPEAMGWCWQQGLPNWHEH